MARVPTYDNLQVQQSGVTGSRFSAPAVTPAQPQAGKEMQQFGQALHGLGREGAAIATDMQVQANRIRVDDALNRMKEEAMRLTYDKDTGFTNLKGINAMERPDGKPLADEYGDMLQKQADALSAGLGNDVQRLEFSRLASAVMASFNADAVRHESSEFRTYSLSTSKGIQSTAMREVGLNYNNPDAIGPAIGRIKAETYRQAQLLGKSAEWQEAMARDLTSAAHKTALLSALEANNLAYADSYLRKYSDQMTAEHILAVRGHITKEMDSRIGMAAAGEVLTRHKSSIQPGESERAFNIAVGTESGGRQFGADGKPLTSKAGAIGIAQVMPDTAPEAAKLAGLKWDDNRYRNDPEYNRALGMAYFQKQLQDNGGDLAKAYAAYNAGHGRLRSAIKQADAHNKAIKDRQAGGMLRTDVDYVGSQDPKTWLDFMPAETKAYVAKNMREFNAGGGQPKRPTFAEIDAELRSDPRLADHPDRYKVAREQAKTLFEQQTAAIKQQDEQAVAKAMQGIVANGGRYSNLPLAVRAAVPPKEIDNLISFAQKISKGDDTTSMWLYNKLSNSNAYLGSLSDDQFYALRSELSEGDFKHFADQRAKINGNTPSGGAGDLNSPAIKSTIDQRLSMLGMDPTPKDGSTDAARVGAIRQFVDQYFLTAQSEAGKKFSDAEVAQHIDAMFAHNSTFKGMFRNSSGATLSMKIGDIPSVSKDRIEAAFKARGIDDPTDAQILSAYWNLEFTRR